MYRSFLQGIRQYRERRLQNGFGTGWSLPIIICTVSFLQAANGPQIQFEGKTSYCAVDSLAYVAPSKTEGLLFNTSALATIPLSDDFAFVINQRLRAVNNDTLFPEQVYPFEHYAYGGLEYRGLGELSLGAAHSLFRNVESFPTPWYRSTSRITPEMLTSFDGAWKVETDRITAAASATYSLYNYSMKPADTEADSSVRSQAPYGAQQDADIWADLSSVVMITDDFSLIAGGLTKQDLNEYKGYDIYRYWAGIAGNHQLYRNRIKLEWAIAERFTQSDILKRSGYATGLSTTLMTRFMWRIKSGFFLKAGAQGELSDKLHKLFFEAQLRKTWDMGSSIDFGYVGTAGVLFPRHGLRLANKLAIHPRFALSEFIETYFSDIGESGFRYYRSDLGLELHFPVRNNIEFFLGGLYRQYDRHPLFASRWNAYGGLRLW